MARDIRVLVWGLGEMGSGIVRALVEMRGATVTGAVCSRPEKVGRDVGELVGLEEPLGVDAMDDGNFATQLAEPDVVVVAQSPTVEEDFPAVETALAYKADVVSLAEQMAYPWRGHPELARRIDELARAAGKTVVGTGARPGLLSDTHILALSAGCAAIRRIEARSVGDLARFGPRVLERFGVGMDPAVLDEPGAEGPRGHVGFEESASMIADQLGVKLTGFDETREPVVARALRRTERVTVEPGRVAGLRQSFRALGKEGVFIQFDHTRELVPEAEGREPADELVIAADPPVALTMRPPMDAGRATVAIACNTIPLVMRAAPGLVAMPDLPVPRGVCGDLRLLFKRGRVRGGLAVPPAGEDGPHGAEQGAVSAESVAEAGD